MRLIILQGNCETDKTEWVNNFVKNKKNWIVINKTVLSKLFPNEIYDDSFLNHLMMIIAIESTLNYNIIINDYNLEKNDINKWLIFAKNNEFNIEFKLFD